MSVGAICFTSSGSNGGCWVVLVFPRFFFLKRDFFFPYATFAKKKSLCDLYQKKISVEKKDATYAKKKSYATYAKKRNKKASYTYFHNRGTLSSTESSDPTQHAKGRMGDCPRPREETTTRRNVTQGGGGAQRP